MNKTLLLFAIICLAGIAARTTSGCKPGMYAYVAGKICWNCPTGCSECDTSGKCTSCVNSSITPNADGACVAPTNVHPSCAEALCEISGTYACSKCAAGFRFDLKDTTATAYCVACSQAGCSDCTAEACNACMTGFFLDSTAGTCTACSEGCATCTAADACTACGAGYFLANNACTACSTGCVACESATKCTQCASQNLLSSTDFTCTESVGCEEQTEDGTKCKTCMDGYRLNADGACTACTGNAALCSGTDAQVIISCNSNFILATKTDTKAAACMARKDSYCIDQNADNVCTKCDTKAGYYLSNGACVSCNSISAGCNSCTEGTADTAATCGGCAVTHYFADGACTACDVSCKSCSADSCECADGFYPQDPAGTSCTACNAGSAKVGCTLNNAVGGCVDYAGSYTHGVCMACNPSKKCVTCSAWNTCLSCDATKGHSLNGGECVQCDANCAITGANSGCATNGKGKCDGACKADFVINSLDNTCTAVTTGHTCGVANCAACTAADYGQCATCNDGFFVSNGACSACSANCKTCGSATASTCTECLGGYMIHDEQVTVADATYCTVLCSADADWTGETGITSCKKTTTAGPTVTKNAISCEAGKIPMADFTKCVTAEAGCTEAATETGGAVANCATCETGYQLGATVIKCFPCLHNEPTTRAASCTLTTTTGAANDHADNTAGNATADGVAAPTCAANHVLGQDSNSKKACYQADPQCSYTTADTTTQDATVTGDGICVGTCANGYFLNTTTKKCEACKTGCATCADATTCATCAAGYLNPSASVTNNCVDTKPANCATVGATADVCGTCDTGYYKTTTNTCSACNAGCTCSAEADKCTGCRTGFVDTGATPKVCKACISNCDACSAETTCTTCKDGFYANEGATECLACPANAATCTGTTSTAVVCKSGFRAFAMPVVNDVAATEVAYCIACMSNCETCTFDAVGKETCSKCRTTSGQYYLSNNACTNKDCSKSDGVKCTGCMYGQKLSEGVCADCISDKSCPASCNAAAGGGAGGAGGSGNTTNNTDSSSQIAQFSLFVLAFLAILGHMMI